MTQPEDQRGSFRPSHNLSFNKRTCFILTDEGEAIAGQLGDPLAVRSRATQGAPDVRPGKVIDRGASAVLGIGPRELRFAGQVVKRYRVPAQPGVDPDGV